jgi:hypothetical protein
MSDPDRCRATAARYARLADRTGNAEIRRSYLELERLWLEMATVTQALARELHPAMKQSLYSLIDDVQSHRQATLH